jgi:hypothetical protein
MADWDFSIHGSGEVYVLVPHTERAKHWRMQNIAPPHQCIQLGDAIVIQHAYILAIVDAIIKKGLKICQ